MKTYKAILFHPEGDFVTDFRDRRTVQEVWQELSDMGSRWIFYPITFVATDKTIKDAPVGLEFLIGKRITTAKKYFADTWKDNKEEICQLMNEGLPFNYIYQ